MAKLMRVVLQFDNDKELVVSPSLGSVEMEMRAPRPFNLHGQFPTGVLETNRDAELVMCFNCHPGEWYTRDTLQSFWTGFDHMKFDPHEKPKEGSS
jgi:hypothetical protein